MLKGSQVRKHFQQVTGIMVGWNEFVVQAMLAMLTEEHVLWIGAPGGGKSYAARILFSSITGSKQMRIQLTKDMMPSALIGNEIPKEYMDTGREIYNLDGGVAKVHFFFGDEFCDASDFLIRTLLTIFNERKFERKDMQVDCPLHSAFLTTNFNRASAAIEAMKDRIIFKAMIPTVGGVVNELEMFGRYLAYQGEVPVLDQLNYDQLKEISTHILSPEGIAIPNGVRLTSSILIDRYYKTLVERLEKGKLPPTEPISPRTKNKLMDVLRASAFLDDRDEVNYDDLSMLKYVVCTLGDDKLDEQVFTEVLGQIVPTSKAAKERFETLGAIADAIAGIRKPPRNFVEVILKVGKKAMTYTKIEFEQFLGTFRSSCTKAEIEVLDELENEYNNLSKKPDVVTFKW